jgi:hypothetical protein
MFAPLITATKRLFAPMSLLSTMYRFKQAKLSAPAGSVMERVSVELNKVRKGSRYAES